jgi:oligosaccharyltransferase complex subunit beta
MSFSSPRKPKVRDTSPFIRLHLSSPFDFEHKLTIFTPDFAKDITPQALISLANLKTNIIVGLSTKQTPLSSLAPEFSLVLPPPGTPLISYFPKRDEPPSLIPITPSKHDATHILTKDLAPVWFSGIPQSLGNNPLLVPILHAPPQSFASEVDGGSADALVDSAEKGGEGLWAGSQLSVVTGFQTLSGARVTWLGGVDMLSDELAQKEVSKYVPMFFEFVSSSFNAMQGVSNLGMHSSHAISFHGHSKNLLCCVSTRLNITVSTLPGPASYTP